MRRIAITVLAIAGLSSPALASLPPHGGLLDSPLERASARSDVRIVQQGTLIGQPAFCSYVPTDPGSLPMPTRPTAGGTWSIVAPLTCS